MATSTCQLCLDNADELLANVCGKSCPAQVCRQCLGRHVEVTLQQFYPGVLPRVRCPVCLVTMHQSRWRDRVPSDSRAMLMTTYSTLCRQACVLTPPCCHKTDYTHLQEYEPEARWKEPLLLTPSQLKKFKTLCKQFCHHKIAPRAVLDYAFSAFGDEKTIILVNKLTLQRVQDPERRASLLLSLMYLRPNTKTNCCGDDFCFNCKGEGHHETCAEEFSEDNDLVRCRGCRALLLKVEGCDAVNCVCGTSMKWTAELELCKQHKRGLLPVDIFDIVLTNYWFAFRQRHIQLMKKLRPTWLQKKVVTFRPLLHPTFAAYVWRFRFRKILATELRPQYEARRAQWVDRQLVVVKSVLQAPVTAHIWRRRLSKAVVAIQSELFWKAYHRWHPEEAEDEVDEVNCFFNIDTFEDAWLTCRGAR